MLRIGLTGIVCALQPELIRAFPWIFGVAAVFAAVTIVLFLSRKMAISSGFEYYSSAEMSRMKLKAFSACQLIMFPTLLVIQSRFLNLHPIPSEAIVVAVLLSMATLVYSFIPKAKQFDGASLMLYTATYLTLFFTVVRFQFEYTLTIETALYLTFSRTMFRKMRWWYVFATVVVCLSAFGAMGLTGDTKPYFVHILATCIALFTTYIWWAYSTTGFSPNQLARTALNQSKLIVMLRDKSGNVLFANDFAYEIFGLEKGRLEGTGWYDFIGADDDHRNSSRSYIRSAIVTGDTRNYLTKNVQTPSGSIDIEWTDFPIQGKLLINYGRVVNEELRLRNEV